VLAGATAGVSPLREDQFGALVFSMKVPEYIAAGLPVICSGTKTMRHYYDPEELFFFEPGDAADLARAIRQVLRDPTVARERSARGVSKLRELDWTAQRKVLIETVDSLVMNGLASHSSTSMANGAGAAKANTTDVRQVSRVAELAPSDARWDEFVERTPGAQVFHHSGWLSALEDENGRPVIRLALEEADGTISGILPLVETRGLPFGIGGEAGQRRLASLPRTPVAGPVACEEEGLRALIRAAMLRAKAARCRLQLRPPAELPDSVLPGLQATAWRDTYVRELPPDPDSIRFGNSRNHSRIMWAIRKAEREGMRVRDAEGEADLRAWYRLYLDVNRSNGIPSRPYRLFRTAWNQLHHRGHMRVLLAELSGVGRPRLLAGSILLMLGDTVHYAFNGRDRDGLEKRPNDVLQWHAIRDSAAAGYRWYDLGEVAAGSDSLAAFKSKWGSARRQLVRYHAPALAREQNGYAVLESEGRVRRLAVEGWRHTPTSITALAGDMAHRFL
jgi:hypothetical protein